MKKRILSLSLALAMALSLVTIPAAAAETVPAVSNNINAQHYFTSSETVKSHLFENETGGLTRVEYIDGQIVIEDYSSENIEQGSTREALSIPLQQFARLMVYKQDELTEEQKNKIRQYLPIEDFEKLYCVDDHSKRKETWDKEKNPNGRWRKFSIDEIMKRPNTSLDISWMSEEEDHDDRSLSEILKEMNEKSQAIRDAIAELNKALEGIDDED